MSPARLAGFAAPWLVTLAVLALHLVLPAREVSGYVRDPATGEPLRYRLNGLRVFAVVVALWLLAGARGWLPWDFLWTFRWEGLAGACSAGLAFTFAIVLGAPPVAGQSLPAALYLGRRANPQWGAGRVDAKMFLYLNGAVLLELNLLSFAAHHLLAFPGAASPGVLLHAGLFSFFVVEYLHFEEVHLYTYDFVAERVGFKLGWGCFTFYPYFYCIGLWATAAEAGRPPAALLALAALVFVAGWSLSRGANLQKFLFKARPGEKLLGILAPEAISDGERSILCSGFWGVSRHVNYLGEFLMAVGLTLALGRPGDAIPWFYPVYYLVLLLPRQADDDRRCAAKYGKLWTEYCRRVRWRIVPGVY